MAVRISAGVGEEIGGLPVRVGWCVSKRVCASVVALSVAFCAVAPAAAQASESASSRNAIEFNGVAPTVAGDLAVQGRLTDAKTGLPIPGVLVLAMHNYYGDYRPSVGWTDADGNYSILNGGWGGTGTVQVSVALDGYALYQVTHTWQDIAITQDIVLQRATPRAYPVGGANRYETAALASDLAFLDRDFANVVIASGRSFPDALAGSSLAGALKCPILLTEKDYVPVETLGACGGMKRRAIIIGGRSAVSDAAMAQIDGLYDITVERIEGVDRYDTAAKVAARTKQELGSAYGGGVMIATGSNFPDALAAAPLAAAGGVPILLAKSGELPPATRTALASLDATHAIVLGGENAVSSAVFASVGGYVGSSNVERLAGGNRYETAAKIAQYGVDHMGLSWNRVGFATGTSAPDALAGGAVQALRGSVLLLTQSTVLEPAPKAKLIANADSIGSITYYGGMKALSWPLRVAIEDTIYTYRK